MKPFIKAILLLAKVLGRIAKSLEEILELYRLDCQLRGIYIVKPSKNKHEDEVEISYGVKEPASSLDFWREK